jgi:hypothetical protein
MDTLTPEVMRAGSPDSPHDVAVELEKAFVRVQSAIAEGRPVTMLVVAADLLGHRSIELAAYVGGLVGIARAVAFEGVREQWQCNVVAVPDPATLTDDEVWANVPANATGQIITLGTQLLGKVAP